MQVDANEELHISAADEMELFLAGLPPVRFPVVESKNFDYADGLGNAIQLVDPNQAV